MVKHSLSHFEPLRTFTNVAPMVKHGCISSVALFYQWSNAISLVSGCNAIKIFSFRLTLFVTDKFRKNVISVFYVE